MYRVMIVEDQRIVRSYFESFICDDGQYEIVSSIANASLAPEICDRTDINLVIMDVMTEHGESGIDAAEIIKKKHPKTKVIIVTSLIDSLVLSKAKTAGADSLWYKEAGEANLMDVINSTMEGKRIFPDKPPVVDIGTAKSYEFTKKEMEVLRFVVKGLTYSQIAAELSVDERTIKYHVSNMLQKTNCENKLQLAIAVHEAKLIVKDL